MTDLSITKNELIEQSKITELGDTSAYTLAHAGTANSGVSIGIMQTDLSVKANVKQRNTILEFAQKSGVFSIKELGKLRQELTKKGNRAFIKTQLAQDLSTLMQTPNGQPVVKNIDDAQAGAVLKDVEAVVEAARTNPQYASDEDFQALVESKAYQHLVGDNINQYGAPNQMRAFMEKTNKSFTIESFFDYESHYSMVADPKIGGAALMRYRRKKQITHLNAKGMLTAQQAEELTQAADQAYRPTAYKIADQHLRIAGIDTSQLTDAMALAYHNQGIPPEEAGLNIVEQMAEGGYGPLAAAQGMTVQESRVLGAVQNGEDISQLDLPESLQVSAGYYRAALASGLAADEALGYALEIEANSRNYTKETAQAVEVNTANTDVLAENALSRIHISGIPEGATMAVGGYNTPTPAPTNAEKASWVPEEPTTVSWGQMAAATPAPAPARGLPKSRMQKDAERQAREMMGLQEPASQRQKKKELEHGLGMITDPVNARKAVKSVFGPSVDADAYLGLDKAIDGVGRIGAVLNGPELSPRQMSSTLKTTKQDGQKIGIAVGPLVDRSTVDKLMRSPAYSNALHPEHETIGNTVRGYFEATTPGTATVTTPDNDPALWSGVQRVTEKRRADQVKADAATESATHKADAAAAPKAALETYGPPTLAQHTAKKQATLGQQGLVGEQDTGMLQKKAGPSLLQTSKPQTITRTATHRLKSVQALQAPARNRATATEKSKRDGGGSSSPATDNSKGYTGTDKSSTGSVVTGAGNLKQRVRGMANTNDGSKGANNTRVICTELVRQGRMAPSLQRLDIAFTLKRLSPATVRGYHFWAVPYVRLMKRSTLTTALINPLATWRAKEIAYQMGERAKPHYPGKAVRAVMEPLCWALGMVLGWIGDPDRFHPNLDTKMSRIL